jgi:hypothetical protein
MADWCLWGRICSVICLYGTVLEFEGTERNHGEAENQTADQMFGRSGNFSCDVSW